MKTLTAILVLATAAVPALAQEKKNPVFTDKEHGFSIAIPNDKKLIRHWEILEPKEGDTWFVHIKGDYANILDFYVVGSPPDLTKDPRQYVYSSEKHAENREEQAREEKTYKKVTRKSLEKVQKFTGDKINAHHLVLEIEDENDNKFEKHHWCFQASRNQWTYDIILYVESGLLEKADDKERVAAQIDELILKSFRAFQVKK